MSQPKANLDRILALALLPLVLFGCQQPEHVTHGSQTTSADLLSIVQLGLRSADPYVRAESVRLAALSNDLRFTDAVNEAARDSSLIVRAIGIQSLIEARQDDFESVFLPLLTDQDTEARLALYDLIVEHGSETLRNSAIRRAMSDPMPEVQSYGMRAFLTNPTGEIGSDVQTIWQILQADDPYIMARAIQIMIERGFTQVMDPLHSNLSSPDPAQRLNAMRVLAQTGSPDAWPALRWMRAHGDEEERVLATLALARIGDSSAAEGVVEIMRSGNLENLPLALRALAQIPNTENIAFLEDYRLHRNPVVRRAAVFGMIEQGYTIGTLLNLLTDNDLLIVEAVRHRLIEFPADTLAGELCPALRVATDVKPILRLLWSQRATPLGRELLRHCAPPLESMLRGGDLESRSLAARLVFSYQLPSPSAIPQDVLSQPEILYAYLEASLALDPVQFRPLYERLTDHHLLFIRTAAAIGLLRSSSS